ncbi:MAG: TIGR01777 family oxidoreductase [Polyangiaceae bacterium]
MKWIVTGGTGLVGKKLVRAIDRDGDEIVIFSRHAAQHSGHVRTVVWDPEKIGNWSKEIEGADVVVHLTGEPIADGRWTDERLAKIRSSRTESTKLLAEAIVAAKDKPTVFVSASAVGYYGHEQGDAKLAETSAPGTDVIAQICTDWESAATPAEAVTRVVHPRIGVVLSPDGGMLKTVLPAFRAFVGGPIGDGKQWVSFVHIDDAIRAILFAVEHEKVSGAFNLTAPNPITMNAFAEALAKVIHRPNLFRVPSFAARLALGKMADVALTGQRVVPQKLLDFGFSFNFPVVEAALQELLVHP